MYETLQLNGHKIDHKDDVRRDDMQEAAASFARNLALGKVRMQQHHMEARSMSNVGSSCLMCRSLHAIESKSRSNRFLVCPRSL
jgi:hypothetical protein